MIWFYFSILLLSLMYIFVKSKVRANGIFHPLFLFSLLVFLGFIIPFPLTYLQKEENLFLLFWSYEYADFENAISKSLLIGLLGLWSFFWGFNIFTIYNKNNKSSSEEKVNNTVSKNFKQFVIIFTLVGMISIGFLFIISGGVSSFFSNTFNRVETLQGNNFLIFFTYALPALFIYKFFVISGKVTKSDLVHLIISLIFLLVSPSKSPIFIFIISLLISYYYRIKRISFSKIALTSLLLIGFFVLWELIFREFFAAGEIVTFDTNFSFSHNFLIRVGKFFQDNFMQLQTVSFIIDSFPNSYSFLYGTSIIVVFLIFIPRGIFPWKPLTGAGQLTETLFSDRLQYDPTTLPPGLLGEFYMNFSWVGVFIGCILFGIFYSFLWYNFIKKSSSVFNKMSFVIFSSLMLHFFRGELSSPFIAAFFFLFPIYLVTKISK